MSNRSGTKYGASTDANRNPVTMGVSTADGVTPVPIEVDPVTGGLLTSSIGMFTLPYDEIDASYPTTTTEVYVSKKAGITQQTITVTYTTTTKDFISSVVRT